MSSNREPEISGWSLAARLTVWYAGVSFLLILGTTGFLYWALISSLEREDDAYLADKLAAFGQLLRDHPVDRAILQREIDWEGRKRPFGQAYLRVLDGAGQVIAETAGMSSRIDTNHLPTPSPAGQTVHGREIVAADQRVFLVGAVTLESANDPKGPAVIQVALDRTYEEEILERYRGYLALTLAAALIFCCLVSYQLVRRGLRPLRELTQTAGRIRSSTLDERVAFAGLPSDLGELASTFNAMLDRLEEAFERLGQFSSDIAHELRTPLSNLRSEVEVSLRQARPADEYARVLGSCLEESVRLSGLVETLLFLARADQPDEQIQRTRVDLSAELRRVRDFFEPAAAEAGVSLRTAGDQEVFAEIDRALIQRAISNLVTNALTYTPKGGTVTLEAREQDDTVEVVVRDTGAGIEARHVPHIFDRFYRADAARTNSAGHVGLGLAIVASIARLHGGRVSATSEVGRGTTITLELPRRRSENPSVHRPERDGLVKEAMPSQEQP